MKSKQLANVLIKMLGFSVCLSGIPGFISGLLIGLQFQSVKTDMIAMRMISSAIGFAVQALIGIVVINLSPKIAGFLFKSEDE